MFGIIKTMFVVLLFTGLGNGSNHTKCVLLTNQKCMTQPTLINLHRNECNEEFHCYPFAVKLDKNVGSCKTKDLNLSVFNMITVINELRKHISFKCKYRFDGRKCNSNHW